jgi:hypothetical protein
MSEKLSFPQYIFGLHEPGGEHLMEEKGKKGWIVFTHELGHDPNNQSGTDYRPWSNRGFGIIARLNHGYGTAGTIPLLQYFDAFAQRVRNFVRQSPGCHIWIIGNEMNHRQERPEGQPITPDRYALCYAKCWNQVHALAGHENDQVVVGATAPWNNSTTYPGNENGDWIKYFVDVLQAIRNLGCRVDALAHHAYTHGTDPNLVSSEQKMDPPFQDYHYQFRCYRDFMNATPSDMRRLPAYITEADQNEAWQDTNRGWVQAAYKEINEWNTAPGSADAPIRQQIRALVLYRWPRYDQWYIDGKTGVSDDFRAAMDHEYVWRDVRPPESINNHLLQGAFLEFWERMGQGFCGLPISDELIESGLPTQYFERLVLQQDPSGKLVLQTAGSQLLAAQSRVASLQSQLVRLQSEIAAGQGNLITEVMRPSWANVVYELPRHPTKRYEMRDIGGIRYLVITHSAVPATVAPQTIASFHVKNMDWPGIGYHFYVDGQGQIFKTNELAASCYQVGEWDPVSVGICVGGNFATEVPTAGQLQSTGHLIAWLLQELGLTPDAVKGKKELVETQSPGQQWMTGKMWKNLLLDQVTKAQAEKARPHAVKTLGHYLLCRHDPTDWALGSHCICQAYIGRFGATLGFAASDATGFRFITVVGDTSFVGGEAEQTLLDSGCRVERIACRDHGELEQILADMANRNQRFLNFPG